jgi:hypothetical protein
MLPMPKVLIVLYIMSFDWFMGLVFVLGWIEDEAPLNSFPTNFEPKQKKISVFSLTNAG